MKMRLEDAIVYVLVNAGRGMTTDQLAEQINRQRLHTRVDGRPVTSAQVYACCCRYRAIFAKEGGLIHLCM